MYIYFIPNDIINDYFRVVDTEDVDQTLMKLIGTNEVAITEHYVHNDFYGDLPFLFVYDPKVQSDKRFRVRASALDSPEHLTGNLVILAPKGENGQYKSLFPTDFYFIDTAIACGSREWLPYHVTRHEDQIIKALECPVLNEERQASKSVASGKNIFTKV